MIDQPSRRTADPAANGHLASPAGDSSRRRVALIAGSAGAVVLTLGLALIQIWPTTYVAMSVVSFDPKASAVVPGDTLLLVAQKYVVIATSPSVLQAAGDSLGIDAEQLAAGTSTTLTPASTNLEILVELPDPEQAVAAANAVAELVVARADEDGLTMPEITAAAVNSQVGVNPPRGLLRALTASAAALLALIVWTVLIGRSRVALVPPPAQSGFGGDGPPTARRPATGEHRAPVSWVDRSDSPP